MKTTPVQELPYPESTDPVADYPTVAKQMVELLDLVLPPIGAIIAFAGSAEPEGWFFCDGSDVPRNNYPKLAQVLGATSGDYFQVPDLRGRFLLAQGGTDRAAGAIGTVGGHQELQAHQHRTEFWVSSTGGNYNAGYIPPTSGVGEGGKHNVYTQLDGGTGNAGNMPPFYVVAYIIRHGESS